MACKIKHAIIQVISESVPKENYFGSPKWIGPLLKQTKFKGDNKINYEIQLKKCVTEKLQDDLNELISKKDEIIENGASKNIHVTDINPVQKTLKFEVSIKDFIKSVLSSDPTDLSYMPEGGRVVVEFSSPNIAKEFHVGHLRSTLIGNVLSNVFTKMGKDVIRLNYFGDWGIQYGLLRVGVDILGYNDESLQENTIQKLQKAYVAANDLASKDEEIVKKARKIFEKLEFGDVEETSQWKNFREWSEREFVNMYERLNVKFDEYSWESMYGRHRSLELLKSLENQGIITENETGRKVAVINGKEIPLLKSDGTTLYILRDILAVFDRKNRFAFDKHYYVVGEDQRIYFQDLFKICEKIQAESSNKLFHVVFGKVIGLSTRKGTNFSLKDYLDEAQERVYEKQMTTATTKGGANMVTADILGTTALIINDLMRRRTSSYHFNWDTLLQENSVNSGIQLQYAHCRLCSLMKNSTAAVAQDCDPDALLEPKAVMLLRKITEFEEALENAEVCLEPHLLVHYLFGLVRDINGALRNLPVKNSGTHLGSQRLLLFNASRMVLAEGLRLLGIQRLEEM